MKKIGNIVITFVLLLGLGFGVYLALQKQNYRGRAEVDPGKSLNVTTSGTNPQPVTCVGQTCTTNATSVQVDFNPNTTQDLLNSLP